MISSNSGMCLGPRPQIGPSRVECLGQPCPGTVPLSRVISIEWGSVKITANYIVAALNRLEVGYEACPVLRNSRPIEVSNCAGAIIGNQVNRDSTFWDGTSEVPDIKPFSPEGADSVSSRGSVFDGVKACPSKVGSDEPEKREVLNRFELLKKQYIRGVHVEGEQRPGPPV